MKIKKIAELTGVSKETIRYYESLKLLNPTRNINGYREYTNDNLNDLFFILNLKKLNLSLEDISLLMALKNKEVSLQCQEETLSFLNHHRNEIKEQLSFMEKALTVLDDITDIVLTSDGYHDEEKVVPLLKTFEGELK